MVTSGYLLGGVLFLMSNHRSSGREEENQREEVFDGIGC